MKTQKGFTIIELIVVIAIIAILAAIVLVNVTTYIDKAKDARIKSNIGSIALGMGGCYGSRTPNAYDGTTCYNGTTGTTYIPGALVSDITAQGGVSLATNLASDAYCLSVQLNDDTYVCIDHTGVTKNSATAICPVAPAAAACPN